MLSPYLSGPRPSTRFLRTDTELRAVLPDLLGSAKLYLDTEFHTERSYYPKLMLVQIRGDEGDIFLIDPFSVDLGLLRPLLETVPLVLHGGQMDMQILRRVVGAAPKTVFDTQVAAACVGLGWPCRLQELVNRLLQMQLDKGETLSDWSRRPLSQDQLRYAADDVWVLPPLERVLRQQLQERSVADIASYLTEEVLSGADDPGELWRLVPGAATLDEAGRRALQALARWRDATAQSRDLPRNGVLSDALMLDLARRSPKTVDGIQANRRMPSQVWKRDGVAILELLQRPGSAPLPLVSRPRAWIDVVRAASRIIEVKTGVSSDLVLSERVLGRLSRGEPLEGWREQLLGVDFFSFLRGESSIRMPAEWVIVKT
jgi:ribonuclease D